MRAHREYLLGLLKWLLMQCIKENSTLRISRKKEKQLSRVVWFEGKQDKQIVEYHKMRKLIKKIIIKYKKLKNDKYIDNNNVI